MTSKLYTAPEVASLLGIELDTLYRYARKGLLRGVKIGKLWRFTESDVDEFVQSRRFDAASSNGELRLLPDLIRSAADRSHGCGGFVGVRGAMSFAEVDQLSDRLARSLMAHGISPGDRVLMILPNCLEFVIACFAVWKAGALLVADSTAIRPANLLHILNDARPAGLILDHTFAEQLEADPTAFEHPRVIFVKDRTFALSGLDNTAVESLDAALVSDVSDHPLPWTQGHTDDVVSITYTSGSTGMPKGVMNTHDSWLAGAVFTRDYPGVTSTDKVVVPLPLYHGLAFRQILGYTLAQGTVIIATDIYQALKWLPEKLPTAMVMVPAACNIVVDHFDSVLRAADAHLRYVEIGSAAIAQERLQALANLLPTTAIHLPYGLTEARVGFLERSKDGLLNQLAAVSPGLDLQVLDAGGQPVSRGEVGEILLKGRGLMKGYWGRPESDQVAIRDNGFRTGDMAKFNEQGKVELLGRIDAVLKVGGRKVIPQEVEMALDRHPAVAESAVVGRPDPQGVFENELHAFVVLKNTNGPVTERDLLNHCRTHLEPYKVPAHLYFRRSLPKSSVGKVLRHAL